MFSVQVARLLQCSRMMSVSATRAGEGCSSVTPLDLYGCLLPLHFAAHRVPECNLPSVSTWATAKMEEGYPSHAKHDQVASDSTHTHIPLQYSLATRNFVPDRLVRIVQRSRCV